MNRGPLLQHFQVIHIHWATVPHTVRCTYPNSYYLYSVQYTDPQLYSSYKINTVLKKTVFPWHCHYFFFSFSLPPIYIYWSKSQLKLNILVSTAIRPLYNVQQKYITQFMFPIAAHVWGLQHRKHNTYFLLQVKLVNPYWRHNTRTCFLLQVSKFFPYKKHKICFLNCIIS